MNRGLAIAFFMTTAIATSLPAHAVQLFHPCYVTEVFTTDNRTHVKCAHPAPDISKRELNTWVVYFAVPASNKDLSDRLVTLGSAAIVGPKWLGITYDTAWGNSFGCQDRDCRPIVNILMPSHPLSPPPDPTPLRIED